VQGFIETPPALIRARKQVSINRGAWPRWWRDSKELFFHSGDGKLMGVPTKIGSTFGAQVPV
jgi:hypothetical protein